MKTTPLPRKHRPLPGEIAFDRCFLPVAAYCAITFFVGVARLSASKSSPLPITEEALAAELPPPFWQAWVWFALGLLLAALWCRALVTLARAWRDPSSRIVRFPASVLLIPFAVVAYQLIVLPYR